MKRSKEGELCCRQRWVTFGAVELTEGGDLIGISRGGWDTFGFSAFLLLVLLFFFPTPQKRNSNSSSAFSCQGSSKSRCETQWKTHSIILHGSAASA